MFNVLIADDNINYAKVLINYLMKNNKDLRLIGISTNGQEVIEMITNYNIDIVILDLKMPKVSGLQVLKILKNKKCLYKPQILVVSGDEHYLKQIIGNDLVYAFLTKSCNLEKINEKISEMIQDYNYHYVLQNKKKIILNELLYLGFNIKHVGTRYLSEVIEMMYEQNYLNREARGYTDNLERYFYKQLARKYLKIVQNIKANINKATNAMYNECEQRRLLDYFSFAYDCKPTPKIVVNTILLKLF